MSSSKRLALAVIAFVQLAALILAATPVRGADARAIPTSAPAATVTFGLTLYGSSQEGMRRFGVIAWIGGREHHLFLCGWADRFNDRRGDDCLGGGGGYRAELEVEKGREVRFEYVEPSGFGIQWGDGRVVAKGSEWIHRDHTIGFGFDLDANTTFATPYSGASEKARLGGALGVTVGCAGDDVRSREADAASFNEFVMVGRSGGPSARPYPVVVRSIGSLYDPLPEEPFRRADELRPGESIYYTQAIGPPGSLDAGGDIILTAREMFADPAKLREEGATPASEGVRVVLEGAGGHRVVAEVRCAERAGEGAEGIFRLPPGSRVAEKPVPEDAIELTPVPTYDLGPGGGRCDPTLPVDECVVPSAAGPSNEVTADNGGGRTATPAPTPEAARPDNPGPGPGPGAAGADRALPAAGLAAVGALSVLAAGGYAAFRGRA